MLTPESDFRLVRDEAKSLIPSAHPARGRLLLFGGTRGVQPSAHLGATDRRFEIGGKRYYWAGKKKGNQKGGIILEHASPPMPAQKGPRPQDPPYRYIGRFFSFFRDFPERKAPAPVLHE